MTAAAGPRLRLGCVQYLNAQPLIAGWPGDVFFDHPAALCAQLAAGELDVALVSSFEFLRAPIYTIVDDISISSNGPVYSVILAYRGELDALRTVVIDPASLTSVNLLRCLFAETGRDVSFEQGAGGGEKNGRLLIGDQAIRFRQQHGDAFQYLDLGEEWQRLTGLPFVYALWLIRPEVNEAREIADNLRATRDANFTRLDELADKQETFSPEFVRRYWRDYLCFSLGETERAGLRKFRTLCENHRLIEPSSIPLRLA